MAQATPPPPVALPPPPPGGARMVEVRLALSETAGRTLGEPRMRRLVEIETANFAVLAPGSVGPLGDHVAYVWVDQPTASKVVVEVRVADRAVERREIAVRGLAGDVAARLVAIAIAEMVRAGMAPRPAPPPPPPPPPRRTPEEIEHAARAATAVTLSADGTAALLPGSSGVLAGPGLEVSYRRFGVSESIFGRWLAGPTQGTSLRWLELGLEASYRFWLARPFRMAVGAEGAFASVHLADATGTEGQLGDRDTWSARAGGKVAFELRVARPVWLSLNVEPGAILRPVSYTGGTTAHGPVQGAWIGLGLGAHFEWVDTPER